MRSHKLLCRVTQDVPFSISLVVATRGRVPYIRSRLPLWHASGFDEIVVVDGSYSMASRRNTQDLCAIHGARYVASPRTLRDTRAKQRNLGAVSASSEWILFQDDDDTVPLMLRKDVLSQAAKGVDWLASPQTEHIILHRRSSFLAFGGYPEDMVAAEDIIMSNRCRGNGKGALVPPWHERQVLPEQPREDPLSRARNAFWYGATVIVFLLRTPARDQALVGDFMRLARFLRSGLSGNSRELVYLLSGLLGRTLSPVHVLWVLLRNGSRALQQEPFHDWQGLR